MYDKTDVVVVGAGPSGSFSALRAAKMGVDVFVCEEHKKVGFPSHCAGHISIRGLEHLGLHLPDRIIENEINGAVFYSPSGREFKVKLLHPVTYVVNRALFDEHLAQLAEGAGAKILLGSRVESLLVENSFVRGVTLKNGEKLTPKVVIDAEGYASILLRQIGLQTFDKSLSVNAVNCEVNQIQDVENDVVEVYFGQKYAPGLFAWIIPLRDDSAKVGLATSVGNAREHLIRFLNTHPIARKKIGRGLVKNPSYHLISLGGPIPKTYFNGFLTVGDAASQVKPTTGGGVIMGLTGAKIAAETAVQAIERNDVSEDFLSRYQHAWEQVIGYDMAVMRQIRLMLNRLSDSQVDKLISLCSQMHLDEVLQQVRDIDFQGKALLPLLKSPATWVVALYAILASLT